ncbi:Tyrosine phenol-lyase [Orchesella cincta]|uniref:Tyrosine phenol-lyase n=1 Tax=Orchesella cincta TaxID=48709 RepID=A0A1D2NMY7_ORCCI|nr:Tyrosine phenol-lyase [Orchesella cincta]
MKRYFIYLHISHFNSLFYRCNRLVLIGHTANKQLATKLDKEEIEKVVGEPITDFSISSGAKKGDNVAGTLLALKVTTASGKELNLVYKGFPSHDPKQKQFVVQFGIFRTETSMYEKIFPRLKELLELRKTVKNKELPIVKYISGFNDDQNDYVCLEDMRPEGYIMQDKFNSLTLAEVSLYETPGDRGTPSQLKFIDFQLSRRGNIFEDLGYFFWTSTTPEFRSQHLDQMLSFYAKSFENTMDQLDFPKPEGFSRGYVIDKFYQGMHSAYLYMPFALSLQMCDLVEAKEEQAQNGTTKKEDEKNNQNGSQSGPPAIDFDAMMKEEKRMMMIRMKTSPRALQRLEDLTREAVELNLLV